MLRHSLSRLGFQFLLLSVFCVCGMQVMTGEGLCADDTNPSTPGQATSGQSTLRLESKRGNAPVLVKVNGQPITEADLERVYVLRMIPEGMRDKLRDQLLGQLIDARLMRAYLMQLKVKVPDDEVDAQIARLEGMLAKRPDGQPVLEKLQENRKLLREEIAVPLMWRDHMRKTIKDEKIIAYFKANQTELDGTKIRVSHILLKAPPGTSEEDSARMEQELASLREQIVSGKTTFEQAAEEVSQAPSGKMGGDIGAIAWEGVMPDSFCQVAFKLPVDEVSQPFRTHFGWHLCVVKEVIPGDLSIEDVRREIIARISQDMWEQKLAELRSTARIEAVAQ